MEIFRTDRSGNAPTLSGTQSFRRVAALVALSALLFCAACRPKTSFVIAVIPRTSGNSLWEPAHGGAEVAAMHTGASIYWNAPTREDDIEGQIALVDQVIARGYQGLVLVPDQALALITPVRRALASGVPTVILSSRLPIPAEGNLSYILNDEETGGRIAAQRIATLLNHHSSKSMHGDVVVLGVNPDISGITTRVRSLELSLMQMDPGIQLTKKMGSFNVLHEQQVAEEALKSTPDVDVIVALTWASARGAITAIEIAPQKRDIKVIAFDPDGAPPFNLKSLDSVIIQNTRGMSQQAVEQIDARRNGRAVPPLTKLEPMLVTRDNIDSPEVQNWTSMDWRAVPWNWSTTH
jgi:ribose transport system substrate-binding protein